MNLSKDSLGDNCNSRPRHSLQMNKIPRSLVYLLGQNFSWNGGFVWRFENSSKRGSFHAKFNQFVHQFHCHERPLVSAFFDNFHGWLTAYAFHSFCSFVQMWIQRGLASMIPIISGVQRAVQMANPVTISKVGLLNCVAITSKYQLRHFTQSSVPNPTSKCLSLITRSNY